MTDCPGSCNAWWRNLTPAQQEASETGPRQGDPYWCATCKADLRRKLTDLDYQAARRAFYADGHHEQPESPSRHSGHHPSPSQAHDDVDEITGWLYDWEEVYRINVLHIGAAYHWGYAADVRSKVIAWLAEHLDGLLECEFAADFGREVAQRHRELLGKNKALPPRRGVTDCPACGMKLLTWIDGFDGLVCGGCNRHVPKDEYEAEVNKARRHLEQAG